MVDLTVKVEVMERSIAVGEMLHEVGVADIVYFGTAWADLGPVYQQTPGAHLCVCGYHRDRGGALRALGLVAVTAEEMAAVIATWGEY